MRFKQIEVELPDKYKDKNCKIICGYIEIDNQKDVISDLYDSLLERSWIEKLRLKHRTKKSLKSRVNKTVEKIIEIFNQDVEGVLVLHKDLNQDIGEYLISWSSQKYLVDEHCHKPIPLSEFWLRQKSGNPGFDMITENPTTSLIVFGEAKYSTDGTSSKIALSQIRRFIRNQKDIDEIFELESFVGSHISDKSLDNVSEGLIACNASFSVNNEDILEVFNSALSSVYMSELLDKEELYLIGIKIKKAD
jgi:hypothetical protein